MKALINSLVGIFKVMLVVTCLWQTGKAEITAEQLHGITERFKTEFQYLSPSVGRTALDGGEIATLLQNVRILFCYTEDSEKARSLSFLITNLFEL